MTTRYRTTFITVLAAVLTLLAACSSGGDSRAATPATPVAADTVRYAAPGSPSTATNDPHGLLAGESDIVRMALTYDVLTLPGPDGRTLPRLATAWEPDATLTRWKVTIRDDARFADGRPVRAADALASLRRMGQKSAENFGRMAMFDLASSSSLSATVLELVTTKPYAEVGTALQGATFVVPEGTSDFSRPAPGSGPYRLVGGDAQSTRFERNESWWGPKPPTRFIEVRAIPDPQARGDALLSGQVDVAGGVPPALVKQQMANPAVTVVRRPGATVYPLVMRLDTKPFDDSRVREAVRLTLDRQQLLDLTFLGFGQVGEDLLTPRDPSSPTGLPPRGRDVVRARQLLADAGYAQDTDLTLHSTTAYPGMDTAATLIARQLNEIGMRVKVALAPPDTYFSTVYAREPFYVSYLGGIPFLDVVRVALTPGSPTNETAWNNPAWTATLDGALAEPDSGRRRIQLGELQTQLRDQGGYAVWAVSDRLDLTRPGLSGLPEGIGFSVGFIDQVALSRS